MFVVKVGKTNQKTKKTKRRIIVPTWLSQSPLTFFFLTDHVLSLIIPLSQLLLITILILILILIHIILILIILIILLLIIITIYVVAVGLSSLLVVVVVSTATVFDSDFFSIHYCCFANKKKK